MSITREQRNARAAIRGFNAARGKTYAKGDEADLADLLTALIVLTVNNTAKYGSFNSQLDRARSNYATEYPAPRIYRHSPDRCPSNHWNDGTDHCADCGLDLNPPLEAKP